MRYCVFYGLSVCFLCLNVEAQNAFYDAKMLGANYEALSTFVRYMDGEQRASEPIDGDMAELRQMRSSMKLSQRLEINRLRAFLRDPFVFDGEMFSCGSVIESFNACNSLVERRLGPNIQSVALSPSVPIPSLSLSTSLIDATSQFLVQRSKLEISFAIFSRIEEEIGNREELKTLFPESYRLLQIQSDDLLPSLGATWQAAFQDDLLHLVDNLDLYLSRFRRESVRESEEVTAFLVALTSIHSSMRGSSPDKTLELLNSRYGKLESDIGLMIRLVNLLSRNLRSSDPGEIWIDLEEFIQLDSSIDRELFFALIYQEDKELFKMLFRRLQLDEAQIKTKSQAFYSLAQDILVSLNAINSEVNRLNVLVVSGAINAAAYQEVYLNAMREMARLFVIGRQVQEALSLPEPEEGDIRVLPLPSIGSEVIEDVFACWVAMQEGEYGIGLMHGIQMIEQVLSELELKPENEPYSLERIFYYGNLMVDILSADNAEQQALVMDRYFEPVGSYRSKRSRGRRSIELNAYPGVYAGAERLSEEGHVGGAMGITSPIGISFSKSLKEHSVSLFVPVIDLSAPFSYRWSNQAEGLPYEINWRQVFSPGIHVVWGVKNVPLSLMFGGQLAPELRTLNQYLDPESDESSAVSAIRLGISLSVDLPMLRLYQN